MNKDKVPFWEENYKSGDVVTFSVQPNPTVRESEYLLNTQYIWHSKDTLMLTHLIYLKMV